MTYDEDRVNYPCGGLNTRTDTGMHTGTRAHSCSRTEANTCMDARASADSARMGSVVTVAHMKQPYGFWMTMSSSSQEIDMVAQS